MNIEIKSKLNISTYTHEKDLNILLKQGTYSASVKSEELTLISEKEPFNPDDVVWDYVGDPEYASIGSDFSFVLVKDGKSVTPDIESDWIVDNIHNAYSFMEAYIFQIPIGNGGCLFVYTTKNEKGHIIGVKLCGENPIDD